MIDYTKSFASRESRGFDAGLRAYMLKIYNYMALALLVTGTFAYATLNFPPLNYLMYNTPFGMIVTFAPIAISLFFFMGMGTMSVNKAHTLFWVYAAVMGMSLSSLGLVYTGQSLAKTFFICSAVFGSMSLYGYTTKKDLTSVGSFLTMGLIALVVVSFINIFLKSSAVSFATSFIGVGIFMGITAWDTQKLKSMYFSSGGGQMGEKIAIVGAFTLYLDFINLFLHMLRFLGDRK